MHAAMPACDALMAPASRMRVACCSVAKNTDSKCVLFIADSIKLAGQLGVKSVVRSRTMQGRGEVQSPPAAPPWRPAVVATRSPEDARVPSRCGRPLPPETPIKDGGRRALTVRDDLAPGGTPPPPRCSVVWEGSVDP